MRPQKVLDQDVLTALTRVFRAKGFEGASLTEIAGETGLKKASLYHRFPEGKKQMAEAVFNHIDAWVEQNIFKPLVDTNLTPQERLDLSIINIRSLYKGGRESCIFRSLSMKLGIELFGNQIQVGMKLWIEHFRQLGIAFGQSKSQAKRNAVLNLVEIQGSLIVSEGLQDLEIFEQTMNRIRDRY